MPITDDELVRYTLIGLEQAKQNLEDKIAELKANGDQPAASKQTDKNSITRKSMSASAKEKIAAAQRARWAAQKQVERRTAPATRSTSPKKRKISAEARARMAEAQRRRWAAKRAAS